MSSAGLGSSRAVTDRCGPAPPYPREQVFEVETFRLARTRPEPVEPERSTACVLGRPAEVAFDPTPGKPDNIISMK